MIRRVLRSVPVIAGITTAVIVALVIGGGLVAVELVPRATTDFRQEQTLRNAALLVERGITPAKVVTNDDLNIDGVDERVAIFDSRNRLVAGQGVAPLWVAEEMANEQYRLVENSFGGEVLFGGDSSWSIINKVVLAPGGQEYTVAYAVVLAEKFGFWSLVPLASIMASAGASAGVITALVVNRSLRRVDKIQRDVAQISLGSLDRRIVVPEASDSIAQLARTMNDMLARLERSNDQQNQFIADASHELRSPIAGLSAQLDVANRYPEQVDTPVLVGFLSKETKRIQRLVDDLLFLSRLESSRDKTTAISVADAVVCIRTAAERQNRRDGNVDITFVSRGALSDIAQYSVGLGESHLVRIVDNLVSNACRHAQRQVKVVVGVCGNRFGLSVVDDGPGIAFEDRHRVFDRFVRLDEARTQDDGGSGLGLAITLELLTQADGHLEVVDSVEDEFPGAHLRSALPIIELAQNDVTQL